MTIKLAENLQMLRKQKGITQDALAFEFGVTNQSVSKWELGLCSPDITLLPKLAEFYGVSIDELMGYKPITSINNIYIQINSYLSSIEDDGELIDAVYRINRLAGACTEKSKPGDDTIEKLINGKHTSNLAFLQTYGKEYGGVLMHDTNSMLVSSFKNFPKLDMTKIREIYRTLSGLCNINVLKVLTAFFEHSNKTYIHCGMTTQELVEKTDLTEEEVYQAMNNLDVMLNPDVKEERWFVSHVDQIPLLLLLNQGKKLFRNCE